MSSHRVVEITGWANGPGYREAVLRGHGEEVVVRAEKRTVRVQIRDDYPLPDREASAIFQSGSTVTIAWGPDIMLTCREMRPDSNIYEALQVVCISQGTNPHGPPNSFIRVFGVEGWPTTRVITERPSKAPATDFNVVIQRDT